VHALNADQPETLQSTGQENALHRIDVDSIGQVTPPLLTSVRMLLVLVWVPTSHVFVHIVDKVQPETLQSTGQANLLHRIDVDSDGQVTPPLLTSVRMLLVLV
jgi:hypothetical protein